MDCYHARPGSDRPRVGLESSYTRRMAPELDIAGLDTVADNRVLACLKLMRPINSIMVGLAVIVGVVIATPSGALPPLGIMLSGFVVGFTVSAASMVLNDIADVEIDSVNAPERPLPSGSISVRTAWTCYLALNIVGVVSAFPGGLDSIAVVLMAEAAAALYDTRLKLSGFPGNLVVAFLTSLPFLYAFTLVESSNPAVVIFWAMVFFSVLGREIAKDIADVEGDSIKGARTIPIVYGRRAAAIASSIFYFAAIGLSPVPLLYGLVERPRIYLLGVLIVDALLAYSAIMLLVSPRRRTALMHKRIVLGAMLVGLITFLASCF